ncbi:MAG: tRNA pseudouridine(55) synthase TruB [Hyphomonadaceae bacterium]|nr:tRNA pseudouridine(55) synthase TruB [Clostridia bacterium]
MDGILNVLKPRGMTSHDVVSFVRKCIGQKKVGHTGTLDPEAVGVLPICIGKGTKCCDLLTAAQKSYRTELILGFNTDTEDIWGNVLAQNDCTHLTKEEITSVIVSFVGEIEQVPPMYSAVKVGGQKLYALARQGVTVERASRVVTILDIHIVQINGNRILMDVHCSKGTYIRTLCQNIGEKLGVGGCMGFLLRTSSGQFDLQQSITVEQFSAAAQNGEAEQLLIPIEEILSEYPVIQIIEEDVQKVLNGGKLSGRYITKKAMFYRVVDTQQNFLALYEPIDTETQKGLKLAKAFFTL